MTNDLDGKEWLNAADVLRLIPVALQHSQLYRIESRDSTFPKANLRAGMKPRYWRDDILTWVRVNYPNETHIALSLNPVLPKPRKRRAGRPAQKNKSDVRA